MDITLAGNDEHLDDFESEAEATEETASDVVESFLDSDDESGADADADGSARPGSSARKPVTKQAAAKAIAKYIELADAPDQHLELLAVAMGVKADPVELAATIVSSSRVNLGALGDILPLADAAEESPYAAMFAVFKLNRDQVKQIWALLTAAGVVSGALTSKEQAAGVAVAEAAAKIGTRERELFEHVRALARK